MSNLPGQDQARVTAPPGEGPSLDTLLQEHSGRLTALGVPAALFAPLRRLMEAVRAANARLNLISDHGDGPLFLHLLDSLQALADPALPAEARVLDVGTGGGFPGLPLLLVRPGWRGLLLDSVRKKTEAVGGIARDLLGDRAETSWARAEALARDPSHRERYDLAFCRAVGRFSTVAELTLPFLKVGGALLAHRGHEALSETGAAEKALDALGGRVEKTTSYSLPGLDKERHIVRVVKVRPSSDVHPRREGVPAKRPL